MQNLRELLAKVQLSAIEDADSDSRQWPNERWNEREERYERDTYNESRLNDEQREIFKYVHAHPKDIIVVQGKPGTGKTFTLKTIAYSLERPVIVISYKHDLLYPFRYVAKRYTDVKFIMDLLSWSFDMYKNQERRLCEMENTVEFVTCMIKFLSEAKMPNFGGALVILDAYTITPKPFLLLTLILLKQYGIGAIISGDKNLYENFYNSIDCRYSSFDIASRFADKQFSLNTNYFFTDPRYDEIVNYLLPFSSERSLNDFAFSVLAALFPCQILGSSKFSDTHLAATHQELTNLTHQMVTDERIKISLYFMSDGCTNHVPRIVKNFQRDGTLAKFLPYLPLSIGTTYFVNKHSACHQARLVSINDKSITLKAEKDESVFDVTWSDNDEAMFPEHRDAILEGIQGRVCNYPIYPANVMTFHKSQSYNIRGNVDLNMSNTSYRGMYVALSRIHGPRQIVRITVPDEFIYLVSAIINFPELADGLNITAEILRERMTNYTIYYLRDESIYSELVRSFVYLLSSDDNDDTDRISERRTLRKRLIELVNSQRESSETLQPPVLIESRDDPMIQKFIKYSDLLFLLSSIDPPDRDIWLHEYILCNSDLREFCESEGFISPLQELDYEFRRYPMSLPWVAFIEKYANRRKVADESQDVELGYDESRRSYVLKRISEDTVLETTSRFCYNVYMMYQRNEVITTTWLTRELGEMLNKWRT